MNRKFLPNPIYEAVRKAQSKQNLLKIENQKRSQKVSEYYYDKDLREKGGYGALMLSKELPPPVYNFTVDVDEELQEMLSEFIQSDNTIDYILNQLTKDEKDDLLENYDEFFDNYQKLKTAMNERQFVAFIRKFLQSKNINSLQLEAFENINNTLANIGYNQPQQQQITNRNTSVNRITPTKQVWQHLETKANVDKMDIDNLEKYIVKIKVKNKIDGSKIPFKKLVEYKLNNQIDEIRSFANNELVILADEFNPVLDLKKNPNVQQLTSPKQPQPQPPNTSPISAPNTPRTGTVMVNNTPQIIIPTTQPKPGEVACSICGWFKKPAGMTTHQQSTRCPENLLASSMRNGVVNLKDGERKKALAEYYASQNSSQNP